MTRFEQTMPGSYFDELYASDLDPWRFASSPYEQDKYAATLAALPRDRYLSALEIGCSIGVLTRQLAGRVGALCAVDVAAKALDDARRRCADLEHVRFVLGSIPADWPEGRFDLILLSEIVYYLDRTDVGLLADRVRDAIVPGGDVVLVHWVGTTNYPLSGDEAVAIFKSSAQHWAHEVIGFRNGVYRLDVLRAMETSSQAD